MMQNLSHSKALSIIAQKCPLYSNCYLGNTPLKDFTRTPQGNSLYMQVISVLRGACCAGDHLGHLHSKYIINILSIFLTFPLIFILSPNRFVYLKVLRIPGETPGCSKFSIATPDSTLLGA